MQKFAFMPPPCGDTARDHAEVRALLLPPAVILIVIMQKFGRAHAHLRRHIS
ncbi:hypothetical protein ACFFHJ_34665 [Planotetraspora thailandica]|uniref:hypothetical protein n=1 Tax=Planotetraspora thailandica TaxID=487172 RepID=UPI00194EA2F1|nr:hypothetical protein [Planotetraspora thailandica]